MNVFFLFLFLSSCSSFIDPEASRLELLGKPIHFKTVEEAHAGLPCQELFQGPWEFGPWDKVIEFKQSRSYIKKLCFPKHLDHITVKGHYFGMVEGKEFYAVPAFFGFEGAQRVEGLYKLKQLGSSPEVSFQMVTERPFDSLIIVLDTLHSEFPIGSSKIYKFPVGKISIDR